MTDQNDVTIAFAQREIAKLRDQLMSLMMVWIHGPRAKLTDTQGQKARGTAQAELVNQTYTILEALDVDKSALDAELDRVRREIQGDVIHLKFENDDEREFWDGDEAALRFDKIQRAQMQVRMDALDKLVFPTFDPFAALASAKAAKAAASEGES